MAKEVIHVNMSCRGRERPHTMLSRFADVSVALLRGRFTPLESSVLLEISGESPEVDRALKACKVCGDVHLVERLDRFGGGGAGPI